MAKTPTIQKLQISGGVHTPTLDINLTGKFFSPAEHILHVIVDQQTVEALEKALGFTKDENPIKVTDTPDPVTIPVSANRRVYCELIRVPSEEEFRETAMEARERMILSRRENTDRLANMLWKVRTERGIPHGDEKTDWYAAEIFVDLIMNYVPTEQPQE